MIVGNAAPMVLILTVDRYILLWALGITFFLVLSVVAILSRGRRWHELVTMFLAIYLGAMGVAVLIFSYLLKTPFVQVEAVTVP
jgi:hypothetical protein